jgi:hypothetical protein
MSQVRGGIVLSLLALFFFAFPAGSATRDGKLSSAQIERMLEIAWTGEPPRARQAAAQLASLARIDGTQFDDAAVESVADLLADSDDIVRFFAARTLGNLGVRGVVFAPRLQALLPWVDCLPGYTTSATGFRFALQQMGIAPEPAMACEGR